MVSDLDNTKQAILHFISSELSSHASNLIGVSIILFTYLTVATNSFSRVPIGINLCDSRFWAYLVIFLIFWILNSGLVFVIGRLAYYGNLANELIIYQQENQNALNISELWKEISKRVQRCRYPLIHISIGWWASGAARPSRGLYISLFIGFAIAGILFLVFFSRY
jgi:hypothetical protein